MPAVRLVYSDLTPFAADIDVVKATAMIEDVLALAERVAPCITTEAFEFPAAAKAVLRGIVLRWNEQGNAGLQSRSETTGPFSRSETYEVQQSRRGAFWPSEIASLQDLCKGAESAASAFAVDTALTARANHADICSLNFGATYCSCGAVLTRGEYPLWEV